MKERRLQTAISKLEAWCMKTGFQLSQSKTVSLHVCRKRHCPRTAPNLTLHNSPITNESQYKYLGVIFDQAATWKPHITQLNALRPWTYSSTFHTKRGVLIEDRY